MTFTDSSSKSELPTLTPQMRHFDAAALSEKAVEHHRLAARLHDFGVYEIAKINAEFARRYTVAALKSCDLDSDF